MRCLFSQTNTPNNIHAPHHTHTPQTQTHKQTHVTNSTIPHTDTTATQRTDRQTHRQTDTDRQATFFSEEENQSSFFPSVSCHFGVLVVTIHTPHTHSDTPAPHFCGHAHTTSTSQTDTRRAHATHHHHRHRHHMTIKRALYPLGPDEFSFHTELIVRHLASQFDRVSPPDSVSRVKVSSMGTNSNPKKSAVMRAGFNARSVCVLVLTRGHANILSSGAHGICGHIRNGNQKF